MAVKFFPLNSYERYIYAVIFAKHNGKWVYARHKNRATFEAPGGHVEPGETPLDAARRELREETGASEFNIWPICDFSAGVGDESQLFYAEIEGFSRELEFEMAEITLLDGIPDEMTYPDILPALFARVNEAIRELP